MGQSRTAAWNRALPGARTRGPPTPQDCLGLILSQAPTLRPPGAAVTLSRPRESLSGCRAPETTPPGCWVPQGYPGGVPVLSRPGGGCRGGGGLEAGGEAAGSREGEKTGSSKPGGPVTCVFGGVGVSRTMGSRWAGRAASSFVLLWGWVESVIITALVGSIVPVRSWGHTGAPGTQEK